MKQEGHCAFSKSCVNTDAQHFRLGTTNRYFCEPHFHLVEIAVAQQSHADDFTGRIVVRRAAGSPRSWPTFAGIMTGG